MPSEKSRPDPALKKGDRKKSEAGDRNVGEALRAVYQDAVAERIPDEMLDLLNQLG